MKASRIAHTLTMLCIVTTFAFHAAAQGQEGQLPTLGNIFGQEQEQEQKPKEQREPRAQPRLKPKPAVSPAVENRINPKRRAGKEGSEEAKLDSEQARELYIRRKRRLDQIRGQQAELARDRRMLATNRARMQARLIETARSLRLSEQRLNEIEVKLSQTRTQVQERRATLEEKTTKMSELFSLMQGMGRQPPPAMITHSRDALSMIRRGMVLATFYTDIEKLAAQVSTDLSLLEAAQKEAETQETRRRSEQAQYSRLRAQTDLLLLENKEQIETTQANLEGLKNVAKIHAANIRSLEDMLPKLDEEVGKQSDLGNYETELKQGRQEVAPSAGQTSLSQPGRMKPTLPFIKQHGLLPLPAQGRIVVKFAQSGQDGFPSKGTHIETRPGSQVVSPCDGWIMWAGPFRSYGQLLIINPGGGYHILVAGVERTQVTVGQFVLAGEPIASMGSESGLPGGKPAARPTLYVEFRKDKQSIDPAPWWSAGIGRGEK